MSVCHSSHRRSKWKVRVNMLRSLFNKYSKDTYLHDVQVSLSIHNFSFRFDVHQDIFLAARSSPCLTQVLISVKILVGILSYWLRFGFYCFVRGLASFDVRSLAQFGVEETHSLSRIRSLLNRWRRWSMCITDDDDDDDTPIHSRSFSVYSNFVAFICARDACTYVWVIKSSNRSPALNFVST